MGFKGKFKQVHCNKLGGRMWSFELTNTDWFGQSVYNIGIYDIFRQNPWFWRNQVLGSGDTVAYNYDTVDWSFCQGDTVVLLDDNDQILQQWTLEIPEYGPGECPECHGSHVCRKCGGQGFLFPQRGDEVVVKCPDCDGLGTCQTCYVPRRERRFI